MSDQQPPAGVPEYLDSGSGPLLPTESSATQTPGRRSRRTAWLVGGGLVGALAIGAGAWAAISFFSQGAQPAEALPSTTVAYAAVDLDPSGSQKIDAFRTLDKFPAFKDKVGIHSVDDVRRKLGDELIQGLGCQGMTFASDIDPWLGDRAAVAAVDLGHDNLDQVSVVQVTDDGKAETGLKRLLACESSPTGKVAFDVHDGWAVLASSQDVVDQVVSATDHASLADDATYQKWTKAVGDSGVVNLYAAPAAGDYLARQLSGLERSLGGLTLGSSEGFATSSASPSTSGTAYHAGVAANDQGALDRMLHDFTGAAATIRFTGDGLELATVSDPALSQAGLASDQGGAVVQALPDDTAVAIGLGLEPGWLQAVADRVSHYTGGDGQSLLDDLATQTGLDVPADIETLVGSSTALSVGKDFDYEAASMSNDGSGVPVAVTVKGDPAAISKVLDKLRGQAGGSTAALGSDSSGDLVAIGPTPAYRRQILAGGHLGDSGAFRGVVPDAGHASMVLYVDIDDLEKPLSDIVGDSGEVSANLAPLQAFGFSAWMDGDVARTSLRVSTN